MHKQVPVWGIMEFELQDGRRFEGLIIRSSVGNNAGSGGSPWPTSYYAEVTIQSLDGRAWILDYLDVKFARDVTTQRMPDYEKAGLVRIIDFPDEKTN
jgi:hypothetical protein